MIRSDMYIPAVSINLPQYMHELCFGRLIMHDNAIIELYFARDERAITRTSEKYGTYCYSVAKNIVSVHEDAQECVNDTWLTAWNSIPPKRPDVLKYFLAKITRGKAIDRWKSLRAKKRGGDEVNLCLEELGECVHGGAEPEKEVLACELTACIDTFLATIPVRERQLFVRRYFFTESVEEIARTAGMSKNHVSVALHRTRGKLKDYLEKEGYQV